MSQHGYLHLIVGPMFASKTTHAATEFSSLMSLPGAKGVYINHAIDVDLNGRRSMECGTTHNRMLDINGCDFKAVSRLGDLDLAEYSIILIDEAQFFEDSDDLRESVSRWVDEGKNVIVAGLISDFKGDPFGHIHNLMHLADDITMHKPFCQICQGEGEYTPCSFTARRTADESEILIGGGDIYYPCCRKHRKMGSREE